tara:strand:- start:4333 stop:4551 length:219 start_codon:yes stop_codon:yes gene_type:complete
VNPIIEETNMKTTTFKNIAILSPFENIIVGKNKRNQSFSFPVKDRAEASRIAKKIMQKSGKVTLNGWAPYKA